jgi:predicted AAA+ superfamily ATPase
LTGLSVVPDVIHYYRTKGGREVDFIIRLPDRSRLLVQVCESIVEPQTRKREMAALGKAMAELGLQSSVIVTRGTDEEITVEGGKIKVTPAWRFLLDMLS